jgi:hypothetical protein
VLTDDPVQAAPDEGDRKDEEGDPDEEALAEALVRRVGGIGADRERTIDEPARLTRGHSERG